EVTTICHPAASNAGTRLLATWIWPDEFGRTFVPSCKLTCVGLTPAGGCIVTSGSDILVFTFPSRLLSLDRFVALVMHSFLHLRSEKFVARKDLANHEPDQRPLRHLFAFIDRLAERG